MRAKIEHALNNASTPQGMTLSHAVESLLIKGNHITCILKPEVQHNNIKALIEQTIRQAAPYMQVSVMQSQTPDSTTNHRADTKSQDSQNKKTLDPGAGIDQIKHIVAVASGKGGVGKSTVAVNMALALSARGLAVGLLDADIYGPSIPIMLNSQSRPQSPDGKTIVPVNSHGISTLSIGYMLENQDAVIWRGPMLHSALQQMLLHVLWGTLDVMIIDMPPGTGDVALTLAQKARLDGAVIVTTPQNVALADARKAISMFQRVKVPILGLIENMSYYQCPACGDQQHIFGHGGGQKQARENQIPVLGTLPLHPNVAQDADAGKPLAGNGGLLQAEFSEIADRLCQQWA